MEIRSDVKIKAEVDTRSEAGTDSSDEVGTDSSREEEEALTKASLCVEAKRGQAQKPKSR